MCPHCIELKKQKTQQEYLKNTENRDIQLAALDEVLWIISTMYPQQFKPLSPF